MKFLIFALIFSALTNLLIVPTIYRFKSETNQMLSESLSAWEGAMELRCRRVVANYAHGVGGPIYSVKTAEKLYQLCLTKNLSR